MIYLIAGLIIGFFVALPVGAAAVLCINRSIQDGFKAGFSTGLGVAIADLVYGFLAVFGLFAISGETLESQPVLRLAGALCIMFLGCRLMSQTPISSNQNLNQITTLKGIITGFIVTISNPMTIIAFVAALSYVNYLIEQINYIRSSLIVVGIFLGSLSWWTILSVISIKLRENLTSKFMRNVNLSSGTLIFIFGIFIVISIKGI
ncbi:MAG: lysine transporter LysE [Candidatus Pelagibacter sp.]|nr:lysine transporter LysE [Candidatus Pelagibacter sp.]